MSFEVIHNSVFLDLRLTSVGRQLASLGRLRLRKAVFSDDEMDYSYETPYYQPSSNFTLSPSDVYSNINPINFDGTSAFSLGSMNLIRGRERSEVEMLDQPFFSSASTRTALNVGHCIALGSSLVSDMVGTPTLRIESITAILSDQDTVHEACVGNIIMIRHHATAPSSLDHFGVQPFVSLFYRINSWDGGDNFTLDRALPNFSSGSDQVLWFIYPWSGISSMAETGSTANTNSLFVTSGEYTGPMIDNGLTGPYGGAVYTNDGSPAVNTGMFYNADHWELYASTTLMYSANTGTESDPSQVLVWNNVNGSDPKPIFGRYDSSQKIWKMNIVRKANEIGSTGATSGYTNYGSISFNGTRHFFDIDNDHRAVGFIYLDEKSDFDLSDRIQISSTTLYMPTLLWHRKPEYISGNGSRGGHWFSDKKSLSYYDHIAQLNYSLLYDGFDRRSIPVGRVYHDLRMIIITHQDLLNAMTYKGNRNWTLPPLSLSLRQPNNSTITGLCKSDKVYLATYVMRCDDTYSSGSSFSYRPFIHCGDIQRIDGAQGGPHSLIARIESSYFPYMRSTNRIASYSGTGWNANNFNIIIKEVDKTDFYGISNISSNGWKLLTTGGEYSNQHSEATISASGLTSYQFTINQNDYDSASDYVLSSMEGDDFDRAFSGLSYGDENFFFGSIDYDINGDPEKLSIKLSISSEQLNSTKNETFGANNNSTYITGIYIMDDLNRVVASAKPSNPIKKDYTRYLEFKLDLIY